MSRMLAYAAARPLSSVDAIGEEEVASFLALAELHRDGWGRAWLSGPGASVRLLTGADPAVHALPPVAATPATAAILYLRFASAGTDVASADRQPFEAEGIAFAHNGALVPRERTLAELDDEERAALRGSTDSELYFALVRRELRRGGRPPGQAVAAGVSRVRALHPEACLNAMLLVDGDLVVVHAPGTVPPPLAAFARRGVAGDGLPPGHDGSYNVLATTVQRGVRIVATTGTAIAGLTPLPVDTVVTFAADGPPRCTPIPPASPGSSA
ncbi:class II glutamine amidotransferase [Herbiconiux sp. 11R-BC]|uniref:class II glutamine amidotransferase n=1 Tax=Herbiconiux sp. 11R-BC TaxID=3111637 RepID=UPI003C10B82D